MERYYYHGVGDSMNSDYMIDSMISIINSGSLKARNEVFNFESNNFDHVCLYRKNEEFDYSNDDWFLHSARGGWIDGCYVFIVSHNIEAEKVESPATDLVDEWRSMGEISMDKIVGIALPLNLIEEERRIYPDLFGTYFDDKMTRLYNVANTLGWMVVDSDEKNFTDRLDEQLNLTKEAGIKK